MAKSLIPDARALPGSWRLTSWWHEARFYWLTGDRGHIGFCLMLILPIVVLGSMIRLAYADRMDRQAERQRRVDLVCLAENVYFEARGEPPAGQRAVAEVTLNRVESSRFPGTICEVVHEKSWDSIRNRYLGAFSWTEFESMPRPRGVEWQRAMDMATTVYDSDAEPLVGGALFYHASRIEPSWAQEKTLVASIGRHIFYE
jgi:spore germination cell wall hydrolase CwlJ-like protein